MTIDCFIKSLRPPVHDNIQSDLTKYNHLFGFIIYEHILLLHSHIVRQYELHTFILKLKN